VFILQIRYDILLVRMVTTLNINIQEGNCCMFVKRLLGLVSLANNN